MATINSGRTPWGLDFVVDGDTVTDLDGTGETWEVVGRVGEGDYDGPPAGYIGSVRGDLRVRRAMSEPEREASERDGAAYNAFMDQMDREWGGLVEALRAAGAADASVWQTGGMCLAIGFSLGREDEPAYAMVTTNGPLAFERSDEKGNGWTVGVYLGKTDDDEGTYLELDGDAGDPSLDEHAAVMILASAKDELAAQRAAGKD